MFRISLRPPFFQTSPAFFASAVRRNDHLSCSLSCRGGLWKDATGELTGTQRDLASCSLSRMLAASIETGGYRANQRPLECLAVLWTARSAPLSLHLFVYLSVSRPSLDLAKESVFARRYRPKKRKEKEKKKRELFHLAGIHPDLSLPSSCDIFNETLLDFVERIATPFGLCRKRAGNCKASENVRRIQGGGGGGMID